MSTNYRSSKEVPTEVLIARLEELADAVTKGKDCVGRELLCGFLRSVTAMPTLFWQKPPEDWRRYNNQIMRGYAVAFIETCGNGD